jgi:predicted acetyltransferase
LIYSALVRTASPSSPPSPVGVAPFHFLDPGPLVDDDLELITPDEKWVDDVVAACQHPLTRRDAPAESNTTRQRLLDFLAASPHGRQQPDASKGWVPQYNFWMRLRDRGLFRRAPLRIAGGISLRAGTTYPIEMYYGHVGYHVYPPARGRHYAERSVRLLLPLARHHGLRTLWITCNPDNLASRRTCERLGMHLVGTAKVPEGDPLYARGDREKCRYSLAL